MTFDDLKLIEPISKALQEEGYKTPTSIQEQAIPKILAGKDLLGCAQTGTGKTAAFAIPILQLLTERSENKHRKGVIKALILTPTRELAIQIEENFEAYGRHLPLKTMVIFGGVKQGAQEEKLKRGVDIRQNLFLSATMPKEIQKLASDILVNPVKVEVAPVSSTADTIDQSVFFVDKDDKINLLIHLLQDQSLSPVIVFSRTKHGADKIAKKLSQSKISAEAIHGNKSQNARQNALNNFKSGKTRILVATDIAARGIDIDNLKYVVNFELSDVAETYVHRIGRTGRAGASGTSFSFVDGLDLVNLRNTEKLIGKKIFVNKEHPFHTDNLVEQKRDSNNKPVSARPSNAGNNNNNSNKRNVKSSKKPFFRGKKK